MTLIINSVKKLLTEKEIKAIVFDFDNTLVDGDYWIEERWRKTNKIVNRLYKIKNYDKVFWEIFQKRGPFYKQHVDETLIKLNYDVKVAKHIVSIFLNMSIREKIYADVIDNLKLLKKKYILGIITNGRKEVQIERIKKLKMDNYFSSIICAHDHPKPSYLPFKKCLEEINLQPKNIVYIGDDYKLDYLPAKEMGFEAVLLDRSKLIHENHNLLSIQNLNCFM